MEVRLKELGSPYFPRRMGKMAMELMCNMTKPLWLTGKRAIIEINLHVLKGLVGMLDLGIYGSVLVKTFRSWKTCICGYEINAHWLNNKK